MNGKLRKISYLINPASNLEKYLTRWIITTIGFLIAFYAAVWIADALKVVICSIKYPNEGIQFLDITKLVAPDNDIKFSENVFPKSAFILLLNLYFLLQSIFILGSTFWEKASFIKTFAFTAGIITIFIFLCRWIILIFYGDLSGYFNVLSSFRSIENMSEVQSMYFVSIIMAVFTLVFWVLAFFRIKESEIINRL